MGCLPFCCVNLCRVPRSSPRQRVGRSRRLRGQGMPERAAAWAGRSDRAAAQHGGRRVRAAHSSRARPLCRVPRSGPRQRLCRVPLAQHTAKGRFAVCLGQCTRQINLNFFIPIFETFSFQFFSSSALVFYFMFYTLSQFLIALLK